MLEDNYIPTIDMSFIESRMDICDSIIEGSKQKVGRTTMYVKKGNKPMHKRLIIIREIEDSQVSYFQASAHAINLGFLSELMDWLKSNRGWVEGEYSLNSRQN